MRFVVAPLTLAILSSVAQAQTYSSMWNVGDSLSDTGRTYGRTSILSGVVGGITRNPSGPDLVQPKGDLYFEGRFSNGRVWVEYLSGLNGLKYDADHNLAWGGAVTGSARDIAISAVVKHLEEQVDEVFRPKIDGNTKGVLGTISGWFSSPKLAASSFGANPLVTLWIGGNNFRQEVEDKDWHSGYFWSSKDFSTPENTILGGVPDNLRRINDSFLSRTDIGQSGVTYYVPTVPDVSTTPKFAGEAAALRTELGNAVNETNRGLKRILYDLGDEFQKKKAGTRIVVVDAAALLAEVQDNPEPFGFKNATQNCVNADTGKYANGCSASNVGEFLFWDQFHPTTKAHEMIAKYASDSDRAESGRDISLTFPYVANIEIRDQTFKGTIGGTGSLIKKGEATLVLDGDNSYSGGTRIDNGTVRVSSDNNLGARTGQLTMRGGALNNSHSFAITRNVRVDSSVSAQQIGGSSFGGTFNTDAGTVLTLQDNVLSGTGDIAKTGAGALDLRSTMADSRSLTEVKQGTFKVNTTNEYRSVMLSVGADGALGGSGTIVGTVKNAGQLTPGNSIGTLTIEGDYIQEDSGSYVLEVDTNRADALHVTGTMKLDGNVQIALDPSDKLLDQTFTFATTEQSVQGGYDEVVDFSPFLSETLSYRPASVSVSFARDFRAPARTDNQKVLADYLTGAYTKQEQGDLDNVFFALDHTVTDEGGAAALDALSGGALGNITTADALQRGQFVRAIEDRMADRRAGRDAVFVASTPAGAMGNDSAGVAGTMQRAAANAGVLKDEAAFASRRAVWGRVFGGPGNQRGANPFNMNGAGVLLGADTPVGRGLAGVSVGYGSMRTKSDDRLNSSDANAYQISLYGSANAGNLFIDGTAAYTYVDYSTNRKLTFGGLGREAAGSPKGHDLSIAAKAGVRLAIGEWDAEPSLGVDWYRLHRTGFQETGAGAASLKVASATQDLIMPSVGVRVTRSFDAGSYAWSPELRARYYHNLGDKHSTIVASMTGIGGTPFSVSGAGVGRHMAVIGAGVAVQGTKNLQVSGFYDASLSNHSTAHNFTVGLKYAW